MNLRLDYTPNELKIGGDLSACLPSNYFNTFYILHEQTAIVDAKAY